MVDGLLVLGLEVPANHQDIDYMGRFVELENGAVWFDWPCFTMRFNFTGSSLAVRLDGGGNNFNVTIDGQTSRLESKKGEQTLQIAKNLPTNEVHAVSIVKMTEASYFLVRELMDLEPVVITAIIIDQGSKIISIRHDDDNQSNDENDNNIRRIEYFGDSDGNGFAIDSSYSNSSWCMFQLKSIQNCALGFPFLLASHFRARIHIEAWSGKGVVKNAASLLPTSSNPMPIYWNRTVAIDSLHLWNFSRFVPDLIIVYLGGNDFFNKPYPDPAHFESAYLQLLRTILLSFQHASDKSPTFLALCGGGDITDQLPCDHVSAPVAEFAREHPRTFYLRIPDNLLQFPDDYGCLEHRNIQGQAKMVDFLLPVVRDIMSWDAK